MGLFEKKKKDAERCPICGKEISFFSGLVIADGTICDDCEKMVRGQFNIEEYYGRENWKISTSDPLKAMTVEELKDMINERDKINQVYFCVRADFIHYMTYFKKMIGTNMK